MISLWLYLGALILLALLFMAWPVWRYRTAGYIAAASVGEIDKRLAENVRIFREHLGELENSVAEQLIDVEQHAQLKLELERSLLDDESSLRAIQQQVSRGIGVKSVVIFCALVLVAGSVFYRQSGSLDDVYIQTLQQEKTFIDSQAMSQNRAPDSDLARKLIVEFEGRLKSKPDNVQYWFLLARAQMDVGGFAQAAKAYQQVLDRDKQAPLIMAELAQAIFLRDGRQMSEQAASLAKSAYTLDPKNTMALGLLGIEAFSRNDYRTAIQYWQKSVAIVGADSQGGRALAAGVEKAVSLYLDAGGKIEDLETQSSYAVKLRVTLGSKVQATPDQMVFIYARNWQGSPMPLAITRIKVSDLPASIQLDETMAMSPTSSLATASDIEVVARISPSGSAKAEPGDWQAKQGPISMKAIPQLLQLEINDQVVSDAAKP